MPMYGSEIESRRDAALVNHTTQSNRVAGPDRRSIPPSLAVSVSAASDATPDVDDVRCGLDLEQFFRPSIINDLRSRVKDNKIAVSFSDTMATRPKYGQMEH